MSARKITRHDMKHDEFVSGVGRIAMWAEQNLGLLAWSGVGVLVAFAIGFAGWTWIDHRNLAGAAALAQVESAYGGVVSDVAAAGTNETFATEDEKFQMVLERADLVIEEHGSTGAAEIARYYRGLAFFELGDMDQARSVLVEFADRNPDHFLAPLTRRKIAGIYESEGNLDEACTRYRTLTEVHIPEFPPALGLVDLGRCLQANGDLVGAAEAYQRVVDEHPASPYTVDARQALLEIEAN